MGTTSEAFRGFTGSDRSACGGCTICLLVLDVTDEYVDSEDCARRWDWTLEERGYSDDGLSGFVSGSCGVTTPRSESRLLLAGCGLAPVGRATRLFRRPLR